MAAGSPRSESSTAPQKQRPLWSLMALSPCWLVFVGGLRWLVFVGGSQPLPRPLQIGDVFQLFGARLPAHGGVPVGKAAEAHDHVEVFAGPVDAVDQEVLEVRRPGQGVLHRQLDPALL